MINKSTIWQINGISRSSNRNGFLGECIIKSNQGDLLCSSKNLETLLSNSCNTFFSTAIFSNLPCYFGIQVHRKAQSLFGSTEVNGPGCAAFYTSGVVQPAFLVLAIVILLKGFQPGNFRWIAIFLLGILKGFLVRLVFSGIV